MGDLSTLLDTSVAVADADDGPPLQDRWAVSIVVIGELQAGVLLAADGLTRAARLRRLTAVVEVAAVLEVDRAVASAYAELRAASGRGPSNDLWIAATALAHDLTLVTRDERQAMLPLVATRLVGAGR